MTRPWTGGQPGEAERRVLASLHDSGIADFSGLPEEQRRLPADFLVALIAGSWPDLPDLCCPLRIHGAVVTGPVRALPVNRDGAGMTLLFRDCTFDSTVDFSGGYFLTLRLIDCVLPAFIGTSLTVKADLDLSGSHLAGIRDHSSDLADVRDCAVYLNHARVGGRLLLAHTGSRCFRSGASVSLEGALIEGNALLQGACLSGSGRPALSARSARFGGNVELVSEGEHRSEADGEICFAAAQITGDLDCSGARLYNPTGRALHCEDLVVESVFLGRDDLGREFEASGRLNFLTATVGGSFFLSNARLVPGPDYGGLLARGGPVTANLRQIRISNALICNNVTAGDDSDGTRPVAGWFLMAGAEMNTLIDNIDTGWPAHGFLDLDGASYERIRNLDGDDPVARRILWMKRQFPGGRPTASTFRPQPYEQLTRVLRNSGLSREADAVAVEKIRMRLAARVDPPWQRIFPRLLMLVSHHGYSTSRALLSFLLFTLLGTVMYSVAILHFDQPFLPFEQEPVPTRYELPLGRYKDAALGCPGLDPAQYALDFALPLINLGQDTFCRFVPAGPARPLWLALHSLYGLLGAALSAVVVLTLTGLLRRD